MTPPSELRMLAAILAEWASEAPGVTLYLFGSRVRGDHRADSDVDVSVEWGTLNDADKNWLLINNQDEFAGVNAKLPGPLHITEERHPITTKVRSAPVVYQDRSVRCVLLPPKP
jgi:predicted nucleotidyltransferase